MPTAHAVVDLTLMPDLHPMDGMLLEHIEAGLDSFADPLASATDQPHRPRLGDIRCVGFDAGTRIARYEVDYPDA